MESADADVHIRCLNVLYHDCFSVPIEDARVSSVLSSLLSHYNHGNDSHNEIEIDVCAGNRAAGGFWGSLA